MSYPDYPNNRLIVGGVDLTEKYRMILVDGYTLEPPEPKTHYVDIPGGNGKLDLTEALTGEPVYENRNQEFNFVIVNAVDFETTKTEVSNFLHGKAFDYMITMDPGYTYHGRFSVSEYAHSSYSDGIAGAIKIKVDAEPYKTKGLITNWYNISDGAQIAILSGRKRVRPKFEFTESTVVCWDGKSYTMPSGSYTMDDVLFSEGANYITFIPANQRKFLTYGEASSNTYGVFRDKWRIFEWYRGIEKWMVSQVKFNGNGSAINGDIDITATFEDNSTATTTVTIGHTVTNASDEFLLNVIDGGKSHLISNRAEYVLHGELPYSLTSPVKSVSISCSGGSITGSYETVCVADTNTHTNAVYEKATYGRYATSGAKASTYGDMKAKKISALTTYLLSGENDTEQDIILEDSAKVSVYVQHEWSDL